MNNNTQNIESSWGGRDGQSGTVVDLWGTIKRHYPAVLASVMFCGLLGAIYFLTTDRVYESTAEILVEEKRPPTFNDQSMPERQAQQGVEQHLLVLKSPLIFESACKLGGLLKLDELKDIDEKSLLSFWDGHLSVRIPDNLANILEISYKGSDPEECRQIVQAVVDAYDAHLKKKSVGLGNEITELVGKGKDELLEQINTMESEYAKFRSTAPVMWSDGEAINLHHERQIELEKQRKTLISEKAINDGKLTHMLTSLRSGGEKAREALRYEALIELRLAEEKDGEVEREAARGYSLELSREYMTLMMEERKMASSFGSGHPDLKVVRARLKDMKAALRKALGDEKNKGGIEGVKDATDYVDAYRNVLRERSSSMRAQIELLDREFAKAEKAGSEISLYLTEDERHRTSISRTQDLFDAVVARLEEINIVQSYGGERMEVIAKPSVVNDIWPSLPIVGAMSLFSGLMLGFAWALLREITNRIFNDPSEIRTALRAPVLGQIPLIQQSKLTAAEEHSAISPEVLCAHSSNSRAAEAYRGVRTALNYSSQRKDHRVIQVTSPLPGDGKSTFVANLGVVAARAGKRVIIIDADMRRPQIHRLYGQELEGGLADVLSGDRTIKEVAKQTSIDNLQVMSAGRPPVNPAELLVSEAFADIVKDLRDQYDLVIVDGPPLLAVSDPSIISAQVDGVMLILRIRRGVRKTASRARELLDSVDSNLIGVVVNAVANGSGKKGGYGYNYGYGYGSGYTGSDRYFEKSRTPSNFVDESHAVVAGGRNGNGSTNGSGNGKHATASAREAENGVR